MFYFLTFVTVRCIVYEGTLFTFLYKNAFFIVIGGMQRYSIELSRYFCDKFIDEIMYCNKQALYEYIPYFIDEYYSVT